MYGCKLYKLCTSTLESPVSNMFTYHNISGSSTVIHQCISRIQMHTFVDSQVEVHITFSVSHHSVFIASINISWPLAFTLQCIMCM